MHMKKSLEVAFILTLACDTLCDVNHTFSSQLDQVKCNPRAESAGVSGGAARKGGRGEISPPPILGSISDLCYLALQSFNAKIQ